MDPEFANNYVDSIFSFAIYQFRKSSIKEMIEEDKENGFSLNIISKNDVYDSEQTLFTKHKICSFIINISNYIDRSAIKSIQSEERHNRSKSNPYQSI